MISDLGESLRRIFAATAHVGTRFHVISIFYLRCAHDKIHTWNSLLLEKSSGKIKGGRKSSVKKKKKSPLKKERKEERVPFCPEKKKNSFLKATGRS